jgi:hypothetical protein
MESHPAKPAQHEAIGYPPLAFFVAPLIQVFEDQHAQQYFHRGRMPSMHQCILMPLAEVAAHLLVQPVIVKQVVQLSQHRVDLLRQLGYGCEHIFAGIRVH